MFGIGQVPKYNLNNQPSLPEFVLDTIKSFDILRIVAGYEEAGYTKRQFSLLGHLN